MESMTRYTFTPFVGYVLLPLAYTTDRKGPTVSSVSSERHWQSGIRKIARTFPSGLGGIRTRDHSIVSRAL